MTTRGSFDCPKCGARANRVGTAAKHTGLARRRCNNAACGFAFRTSWDGQIEVFDSEYIPERKKRQRVRDPALYGYNGEKRRRRTLRLAPHHYLTGRPPFGWSRYREYDEGERGFSLLRDPETGRAVARKHGDLKPGEISLVLE